MKAYGGRCIYPRILDLGIRWEWSASRPDRFDTDIDWIGPQNRPGRRREKKEPQLLGHRACEVNRYTDCAIPAPVGVTYVTYRHSNYYALLDS
jgi:hypothetical protein